jgi:hypothetical protein
MAVDAVMARDHIDRERQVGDVDRGQRDGLVRIFSEPARAGPGAYLVIADRRM